MPNIVRESLAFSPDLVRRRLLDRIAVPQELVNKALRKMDQKLDAKETKFFTFQGEVVQKVDVEAHAVQQKAIDQVLEISGLKVRERDSVRSTPQVAFQVLPDGTIQVVVGAPGTPSEGGPYVDQETITEDNGSRQPALQLELPTEPEEPPAEQVTIIKVAGGKKLPDDIRRILFEDTDG